MVMNKIMNREFYKNNYLIQINPLMINHKNNKIQFISKIRLIIFKKLQLIIYK